MNDGRPEPFHQIETNTAINPINSGGPLLDEYGTFTGTNFEGASNTAQRRRYPV